DGSGKIPGRNGGADTEGDIDQEILFALHWSDGMRTSEAEHFAAVEFEKVDCLGGIGVGFDPRFADFVANPRLNLKLALANDIRRAEEALGTLFGGNALPRFKGFGGCFNSLIGKILAGRLEDAENLRRMRRVRGGHFGGGGDLLPANVHRV